METTTVKKPEDLTRMFYQCWYNRSNHIECRDLMHSHYTPVYQSCLVSVSHWVPRFIHPIVLYLSMMPKYLKIVPPPPK